MNNQIVNFYLHGRCIKSAILNTGIPITGDRVLVEKTVYIVVQRTWVLDIALPHVNVVVVEDTTNE